MEEKYHICWSRQKPTSKTLRQQDIQWKWKEAAAAGLVERTSLSGSWVGILAQQHPQKPHASVFLQSGGTPNILDGTNATLWPRNITRSEPIRKTVPIHKSIIARQSILRIPYFPLILHFFKISWKELSHLGLYAENTVESVDRVGASAEQSAAPLACMSNCPLLVEWRTSSVCRLRCKIFWVANKIRKTLNEFQFRATVV